MKKILFLGVGRRVELIQSFRQAALCLGKKILIYGEDVSDTAPALAFCDRRIRICRIKDGAYINELLENCRGEQIDLVIPTIDTNLQKLAENKAIFEKNGIKVLISDLNKIMVCRDKSRTFQFFVDCGLKAPLPVDDWREYRGGYPAFIKPKDGSSSTDAYRIENADELKVYASKIEGYIVQPFINGTEYTVDIFADFAGNPVYITPRARLAVRDGEVLKTQVAMDEKIILECRGLTEAFCPCGPLTVQLIRDTDGNDYYLEINPRFGGGSPLTMKAGAKSAEALLQLLDGEEIKTEKFIEDKSVYSRFDQCVCIKTNRMHPVKGVVFDLDDTLYAEKDYVRSGYKAVAEYLGDVGLADEMWEYFCSGRLAIDECLKRIRKEELLDDCVNIYRGHKPKIHLYNCVEELMEKLAVVGIRNGIITDGRSDGQRNKISALGLIKFIEEQNIIITDELGGTQFRKPCDIAFRMIANRWRLPYENIVYIGDNADKDFQAPQQLGMQCIWFKNKDGLYSGETKSRMRFIDDITELKDIVFNRN